MNVLIVEYEPECPVEAIHSDAEDGMEKWININREFAEKWPNILKKEPPSDANEWQNVENKYEKYFSDKPGE